MTKVPSAVWIVDTNKEHLAVDEARKLGIPVIAILDTNCDPDEVDYPIPGNDDAIRSVALLTRVIADAVAEGLMARAGAAVGGETRPRSAPTSRWPSGSASCSARPAAEAVAAEAVAEEAVVEAVVAEAVAEEAVAEAVVADRPKLRPRPPTRCGAEPPLAEEAVVEAVVAEAG